MRKKLILYFKRRNHARKQWVSHHWGPQPWNLFCCPLPSMDQASWRVEMVPATQATAPWEPWVLSLIPECPGHEKKPRTARETGKDSSCLSEAGGSRLSCLKEARVWVGGGAGDAAPPFPTWKRRKHNISWENWSLVRGPTVDILGRERSVGRGEGRGWAVCWVTVIAGDSLRNEPFPAHCAHSGLRKVRTQRSSEASLLSGTTPAFRCMHTPVSAGRQPQGRESTCRRTPLVVV